MQIVKINQTNILELKSTIYEIQCLLNNRRVGELEGRLIEIICSEDQKIKNEEKIKKNKAWKSTRHR